MGIFSRLREVIFGRPINIQALDCKNLHNDTLTDDEIFNYFEIDNFVVQAKQESIREKFLSAQESDQEYDRLDNLFKYSWCKKWCEISNKKLSIYQSDNFIMLSHDIESRNENLLKFAENACDHIYEIIGDQLVGIPGKILIFHINEDDYIAMENLLYDDSTEGVLSGGMFVNSIIPYMIFHSRKDQILPDSTLAHELTHALLSGNQIPIWLDEALACSLQKSISGYNYCDWSLEKGLQNISYWDEKSIQQFWTGESFKIDKSQDYSYLLAQGLLNIIIRENKDNLKNFISKAKFDDSGEQAALECFGVSLGEIANRYMGEGPWQPDCTYISNYFN